MARQSVIPSQTVIEEISAIEEYVSASFIRVSVGVVDGNGKFVMPQQFRQYEIKGDNFAELMSASPSWAPNKPSNTYRNDDLWIFIDRIRNA